MTFRFARQIFSKFEWVGRMDRFRSWLRSHCLCVGYNIRHFNVFFQFLKVAQKCRLFEH